MRAKEQWQATVDGLESHSHTCDVHISRPTLFGRRYCDDDDDDV